MTTGPGPMLVGCDCTAGFEVVLVAATTLVAPVAEFAEFAVGLAGGGARLSHQPGQGRPMLLWSSAIRDSVAANPAFRMFVKVIWAPCMSPAPRSVEAAATALVTVSIMANGEASMSTPVIATSPIRGARAPRSGAPLAAALTVPEFDAATDPALTPVWVPVPLAPAPDCKKPVSLLIASVRPLRSAVMRLSRCATPKPAGKSSAVAPVRLAMVASATKLRLFMNAAGVPARSKSSARASPDTGRRMESGTVTAGAAAKLWVVAVGAAPEALGTRAALGARVLAVGDGWSTVAAVEGWTRSGRTVVVAPSTVEATARASTACSVRTVAAIFDSAAAKDVGCVDVGQMNGGSWGKRDGGDDAGRREAGQQI